jgi:ABC-type transport system involved in cytochrome bd biosynthesis fused ATPase/permease subunit
MRSSDPLVPPALVRPRIPRVVLAIAFGVLSLGSALALIAVAAWLITRASGPPVLELTVAVVAVRALAIARGVFGYCERLASRHRAARGRPARERIFAQLAGGSIDRVSRRRVVSWSRGSVPTSITWPTPWFVESSPSVSPPCSRARAPPWLRSFRRPPQS